MGWIHDRFMKTGCGIGGMRGKKHKGPLRKIIRVLRPGSGMFDRDKVELECGHESSSATIGARRARCKECARGAEDK